MSVALAIEDNTALGNTKNEQDGVNYGVLKFTAAL
jgi:hypothetical protein